MLQGIMGVNSPFSKTLRSYKPTPALATSPHSTENGRRSSPHTPPMRPPCLSSVLPSDDAHRQHKPNNRRSLFRQPFAVLLDLLRRHAYSKSCLCTCRCAVEEDAHDDLHLNAFEDMPGALSDDKNSLPDGPRVFSYAELYIGSCGFSEKEVLGSGGFGRVYRAVLPRDGSVVAVKCITSYREEKGKVEKAFAAELAAVARLRHRNLVSLRGWCVNEKELLIVYDYMPNKSLDRLLFDRSGPSLAWERRIRIAEGLAAALFYLHEQLDTQIIHRDIKASNVMLDSAYNARLGDFGLARWLEHDSSTPPMQTLSAARQFRLTNTSQIGGTVGYLPPESFERKGAVTVKSDVFSFGIVALELATGRRAIDLSCPDEQIVLLDWVRRLADEEKNYTVAMDRRLLEEPCLAADVRRLIDVGLLCSLNDPRSRPTMKWVMEVLADSRRDFPPLPTFKCHPDYYISFSSNTSGTDSLSLSNYRTVVNSTVFLTAKGVACNPQPRLFHTVDAPRDIPLKEIVAITDDFSDSRKVAELDFGTVYRGYLKDPGADVVVKRLGMNNCPALRLRFADEIRNVSRLRHRNLVRLCGWCMEEEEMIVVYEHPMSNLLGRHLFKHQGPVLTWRQRYSIIKSLASAVLYLHEEWDEQVIHRNITSSAIFLDDDANPRLGCFALAEFLSRNDQGHCHAAADTARSTRGIFGYIAPEYMESGEVTAQADVYSFGVVVLEVVTGQKAVDFRYPEAMLTKRIRDALRWRRAATEELVDGRLDGQYDREELARMVMAGMACVHSEPECRPCMREIVSILDGNDELLRKFARRREGKEWEGRNASSLSIARRIQAIGIH